MSFTSGNSASSSFDAAGGFGSVGGEGRWQVATGATGESLLRLDHADGSVAEFELGYQEGKTLLNGSRYFRTPSKVCD